MSKKAFTLIELAIVLLVIGILAGIVLRNLGGFTATARDSRRIADLRNVATYLGQYFLKYGYYPTATVWATTAPGVFTLETALRNAGILATGTILVNDPVRNKTYGYAYCTTSAGEIAGHYVIWADLEVSNVNNAPQLFRESAVGDSQKDWGWYCQPASVLCATGTNISRYCVAQ
jgi:prepilin-type N-terminal cleavage/methylation domain-containing protein